MADKLLFVHYNPNSSGSFVTRSKALINHYSKNYEVHLLLPGQGPFKDSLQGEPVVIHDWKLTERDGIVSYAKAFFKALKFFLANRFKLIYFMDFVWWKPAEVLAAKVLRIPMVAFIAFYKDKEAFKGFIRWMSLYIANSRRTAEDFVNAGFEARTKIIHNFIDVQSFTSVENVRDELFPSADQLVGYVGVLHSIKGIEYFIDAIPEILSSNPKAKFVIVGWEKEDGVESSLKERVQSLDLEDTVRFAGQRDDIPQVMSSIDVLVVPSLDEPFGYINIEAGAAGVPVVASRVGGIPEIVKNGETGYLVAPKRPDLISEYCNKLLEEDCLRENMGQAAKRHIEENFSVDSGLSKFDKLFGKFL